MPFGAPFPGSVLAATKVATVGPSGNAAGTTFSGVNFGTAFAGRYLLASFGGSTAIGSSAGIAVTIGGVSATKLVHNSANAVSVETFADIWLAPVPTGTSGTITISAAGNVGLTLYSLSGLASATADGTGTGTTSASVAVASAGTAFGSACANASGSGATWTGLTDDGDAGVSSNISASQASSGNLAAQTLNVTASIPSTIRAPCLSLASLH